MSRRLFWTFLTAGILALHASRAWSFLADPQFYGEEGKIFFLENFELGAAAISKTYAGYLHLFPRLVAFAGGGLSLGTLPFYFHLAALVAHALLLYSVMRFSQERPRVVQALLAVLTIALPHGGEVFMNLPNTISFLAPIPVFLLLAPRARGWVRGIDAAAVLVAALSGPYSLIWLPLMAAFLAWRRRGDWLLLTALAAGAVIQFGVLQMGLRPGVTPEITWNSVFRMISAFWGPLFFGWFPQAPSVDQTTVLLLVGLGLLWWRLRRRAVGFSPEAAMLVMAGLALWAAAIKGSLGDFSWMHPLGGGMRYFWTPYILVTSALAVFFAGRPKILTALCALIFVSAAATWISPIVMQSKSRPPCPAGGGAYEVDVVPPAWNFTLTLKQAKDVRRLCAPPL